MPEARFAHAATENQVFEAILLLRQRSPKARYSGFFIINLPSRADTLGMTLFGTKNERYCRKLVLGFGH